MTKLDDSQTHPNPIKALRTELHEIAKKINPKPTPAKLNPYNPPPFEGCTEFGTPTQLEWILAWLNNWPVRYLQAKMGLSPEEVVEVTGTSYTSRFWEHWNMNPDPEHPDYRASIHVRTKTYNNLSKLRVLLFAEEANKLGKLPLHGSGRVLPSATWEYPTQDGWHTPRDEAKKKEFDALKKAYQKRGAEIERLKEEIELYRKQNLRLQVKLDTCEQGAAKT